MERKPVILCVDDEPLVRGTVARVLERAGATVLTAANGLEALRRLSEARARPDLVLTDLQMPGMDGETLLRALREDPALAAIPVAAMSDSLTAAPFDLQIAKPFGPAELVWALRAFFSRGG